ncbi:hypothetical protein, variant [Verruconis gallopava]|nr:hypothetical protein, variant [Verruconis gallopava]KIW02708.1 hypothetical protein, variant [Verruconis gallopava]
MPHPSMHPAVLARQMLEMALMLQYFPPPESSKFSEDPRIINRRLADEAIKLVTTNEELHGTMDALECIMLEAMYHSNHGNLRRAWLATRRSIMVAQMMGIDRWRTPHLLVIDTSRSLQPHYIWHNLIYTDRFLSLILGLPSSGATPIPEFERQLPKKQSGTSWLTLELKHSQVAHRLLQRRNGMEDYNVTQEIDTMLLDAARSVPDEFWSLPKFDEPDTNNSAFWRSIRATNQVKHYSLVNCLHLPYLLREDPNRRYEYSKIACLMASREIIRRYNSFRNAKPVLSCCRPMDFVALIAALSLMIGHLNMHQNRAPYGFLQHQRPGDRALVEQLAETMDRVANLNEDAMTYQSSCLIRRLMHIEADAFQGHCYLTEKLHNAVDGGAEDRCNKDECHVLHIFIPYYGTIKISRQSPSTDVTTRKDLANSPSQCSENVADSRTGCVKNTGQKAFVAPYLVSTGNIDFSLHPDVDINAIDSLQPATIPYPDLTASVDDWAFQGVDTAFFGNLIGPNAYSVAENGTGSWEQTAFSSKGTEGYLPPNASHFGMTNS